MSMPEDVLALTTTRRTQVREMELEVLARIRDKTGLDFHHICGIDMSVAETAAILLPVIHDLIPATNGPVRHALYSRLSTPLAEQYVDDILGWLRTEEEELYRETLIQVLRVVGNVRNAAKIWEVFSVMPPTPSDSLLLTSLAQFPVVADSVVQRILTQLNSFALRIAAGELVRTFALGYLQQYSRVADFRVRQWFRQYTDATDAQLRRVARRVMGHSVKLPASCWVTQALPKGDELFSTEVDDSTFVEFLSGIASRFRLRLPAAVRSGKVLAALPESGWVVCASVSTREEVDLCLRLSDYDTVEIRLVRIPTAETSRLN